MSINDSQGDPAAGFGAVLGEAARAYLNARRWLWIGLSAVILNLAVWLTVTILRMTGLLAPEVAESWQQISYALIIPLGIFAASAGGSLHTAAAWLRSVQHRLAPGSYTSSPVADARRFAHQR
ncbi:hypothetical protein LZ318_15990 [Saccharopolyspora indica]|uniref:hypothetical protein n=1 Tax=Saccharopolyspora indica TaxID=1229659 RepID=UPI0022EB6678|nr:hypothetical protein [Saccharopolyspora indica]MDA3645917.1 hypothetical protein [Saccharopolyspora indica]